MTSPLLEASGRTLPRPRPEPTSVPAPNPVPSAGRAAGGRDALGWFLLGAFAFLVFVAFGLGFAAGAGWAGGGA